MNQVVNLHTRCMRTVNVLAVDATQVPLRVERTARHVPRRVPGRSMLIVLGALVVVGLFLWLAVTSHGSPDPAQKHLNRAAADTGILVFREGLESILVLAAITASLSRTHSGILLGGVLVVMVGETVQGMQQAHWIATTKLLPVDLPDWMNVWFSLYNSLESLAAQLLAVAFVIGSYLLAEYVRLWRPRRQLAVRAV